MRKNDAFEKRYLTKEDVTPSVSARIFRVTSEEVDRDKGKSAPVIWFDQATDPHFKLERGMVVNTTNWELICLGLNMDPDTCDSDEWVGHWIELYNDPSIMFGGKRTGGIRVRPPSQPTTPATPAAPDTSAQENPQAEPPF